MRVIARTVLLMFIMTILLSFVTCVGALANPPPVQNPDTAAGAAVGSGGTTVSDGTVSPGNVVSTQGTDTAATVGIRKLAAVTLKYLQMLGSIAAVIILAVFGVQWLLASSQQKAQLKEKMWAYVIGAVLAFGGPMIFAWIAGAFDTIFTKPTGG